MLHRAVPILAVALLTAGCGDPYADQTPTVRTTASAVATSAAASHRAVPAATSSAAVRDFTNDYINWTFANLSQLRRRLATRSTGPLRTTLLQESAHALTQSSRRVSNQANSGTVRLVGRPDATGAMLVVTRETAHLGDLKAQAGHFIYEVKVSRQGNAYKLSEFKAVN
jgi:hypothetical protein